MQRNYMTGPGSRGEQNALNKMVSVELLRKNYSIVPILCIIGFAIIVPTLYCVRLATKSTDVNFAKHKARNQWDDYEAKAYKFVNVSGEKEAIPIPRPMKFINTTGELEAAPSPRRKLD